MIRIAKLSDIALLPEYCAAAGLPADLENLEIPASEYAATRAHLEDPGQHPDDTEEEKHARALMRCISLKYHSPLAEYGALPAQIEKAAERDLHELHVLARKTAEHSRQVGEEALPALEQAVNSARSALASGISAQGDQRAADAAALHEEIEDSSTRLAGEITDLSSAVYADSRKAEENFSELSRMGNRVIEEKFPELTAAIGKVFAETDKQLSSVRTEASSLAQRTTKQIVFALARLSGAHGAARIKQSEEIEALIRGESRKMRKLLLWLAIPALILLGLLLVPRAHGQGSSIYTIKIVDNADTTLKTFASPFKIKCGANLTCTITSGQVSMAAGAGGSVAWDAITNPATGNLGLAMAGKTTTFTWNATTGSGVNLFSLTDTLNNAGTGYIFSVNTASGSAAKPVRFAALGTANGVEMDTAGQLKAIGSGSITATGLASNAIAATTNFLGTLCGTNQVLEDQGAAWACINTPGGGGVTSVFTRTGAVVAVSGDYTAALVTNAFDVTAAATLTNVAAPASPAAGFVKAFADSTDLRFHDKNASGVIGTTVVADAGTSNNFLTAISAAGAISKAQPSIANLSSSTSASLATVLSDETGTDKVMFNATPVLTGYTVAGLPAAGTAGRIAVVTDASAAGSCTSGGGGAIAFCRDSGAAWAPLGDGGGAAGANTALSNLASVSINAALTPQTTLDLGSTSAPWRFLYLYGAGTYGVNNQKITSTAPTAVRTFTLPDADSNPVQPDTGAANNYISAIAASGVITKSQPSCSGVTNCAVLVTAGGGAGIAAFNAGTAATSARSDHTHRSFATLTWYFPGTPSTGVAALILSVPVGALNATITDMTVSAVTTSASTSTFNIQRCTTSCTGTTPTFANIYSSNNTLAANTSNASFGLTNLTTTVAGGDQFKANLVTIGAALANVTVTMTYKYETVN